MLSRLLYVLPFLGLTACPGEVVGKLDTKPATPSTEKGTSGDGEGEESELTENKLPKIDEIVTSPEDRPPPSEGGEIRRCDTAATAAKPIKDYYAWVSSKALSLGAGIGADGRPDMTAQWVTGTPKYTAKEGPLGFTSKKGWDLSAAERVSGARFEKTNMLITLASGKNAFEVWAAGLPPTATRLTISRVDFTEDLGTTSFAEPKPTAEAPEAGKYVSAVRAKAFAGFTFAIEVASECEMGAIADVLGTKATLEALAAKADDPKLKEVLIRAGALVSVSITSNRRHDDVEALVRASGCSAEDPVACRELFTSLDSWVDGWRGDAGRTPTYATISTAKDAFWSYSDFLTAALPRY